MLHARVERDVRDHGVKLAIDEVRSALKPNVELRTHAYIAHHARTDKERKIKG